MIDLEAIRARAEAATKGEHHLKSSQRDIPALLEEVARLRAIVSACEGVGVSVVALPDGRTAVNNVESQRVRYLLEGICHEFERTISHVDNKGGMQVPDHGDFSGAARVPSVLAKMRWWAREMRAVLGYEAGAALSEGPK